MGHGPLKSRCPEPVQNSRAHTYNTNSRPRSREAAAAILSQLYRSNSAKQNSDGAQRVHEVTQLFIKTLKAENFIGQNTNLDEYLHKASQRRIHVVLPR